MSKLKNILLFFSTLTLLTTPAWAASYMKLGTTYIAQSDGGDTYSRLLFELGGGWIAKNGFTAGFLYATEKINVSNGSSGDRSSFGPNIGYASSKDKGWYAIATYLMSSTTTNEFKGTGNQIDVGYKFMVNKVSFAPQLSRKQYSYTTQYGNDLGTTYEESRIDPYFVVWIDF